MTFSLPSLPPLSLSLSLVLPLLALLLLPLLLLTIALPTPLPLTNASEIPPPTKDAVPFLGSVGFFTRRWEFFSKAMKQSRTGNFSFVVGGIRVVGVSGVGGREHL